MRRLRVPSNRRPTLPGELLVKEFLEPHGITQTAFARQIGVTFPRLNEIVRGKRAVTVDTARRFARATNTSPDWWLNMQQLVDLYDAQQSEHADEIAKIVPFSAFVEPRGGRRRGRGASTGSARRRAHPSTSSG